MACLWSRRWSTCKFNDCRCFISFLTDDDMFHAAWHLLSRSPFKSRSVPDAGAVRQTCHRLPRCPVYFLVYSTNVGAQV